MVPLAQNIWDHEVIDSIIGVNRNNRGAESGMAQVTEKMRLVGYNITSLSESSIDILDQVELVKRCLFVGGMIETYLLKSIDVALDGTKSEEFCRYRLDVQINIVIFVYNREQNEKWYRNQKHDDANHQHGTCARATCAIVIVIRASPASTIDRSKQNEKEA